MLTDVFMMISVIFGTLLIPTLVVFYVMQKYTDVNLDKYFYVFINIAALLVLKYIEGFDFLIQHHSQITEALLYQNFAVFVIFLWLTKLIFRIFKWKISTNTFVLIFQSQLICLIVSVLINIGLVITML